MRRDAQRIRLQLLAGRHARRRRRIGHRLLGTQPGFRQQQLSFTPTRSRPPAKLLWGSGHVKVFDGGSLQFGSSPTSSPTATAARYSPGTAIVPPAGLRSTFFRRHRGFPAQRLRWAPPTHSHVNGSSVGLVPAGLRRKCSCSGRTRMPTRSRTAISGRSSTPAGARQWGDGGLPIVPLGTDSQDFARPRANRHWRFDLLGSIRRASAQAQSRRSSSTAAGNFVCPQFPVSTASADNRLWAGIASSGLAALAWEDDRNGENDIFIQNVNPDCSLGIESRLRPR